MEPEASAGRTLGDFRDAMSLMLGPIVRLARRGVVRGRVINGSETMPVGVGWIVLENG